MKNIFKILLVLFTINCSLFTVKAQFTFCYVNTQPSFDTSAQIFITNANIIGYPQKVAINNLVLDLKGLGATINNVNIWDSLIAIWPFAPTTNTTANLNTYAYNLKAPYIYDSTFYMDWYNDPTVTPFGINGEGFGYGLTGFFPINYGINNIGVSVYKNFYDDTNLIMFDFGCFSTGPNRFFSLLSYFNTNNTSQLLLNQALFPTGGVGSKLGVSIGQRTASNSIVLYQNGVSINSKTTASTTQPLIELAFMGRNSGSSVGDISRHSYGFAAIHKSLTANQIADFNLAIKKYQSYLRR